MSIGEFAAKKEELVSKMKGKNAKISIHSTI